MRCLHNHLMGIIALLLVGCGASDGAQAEPFPALSAQEAAQWSAVGRVNAAGFRSRGGCTGTLVAPDLVATAAHCAIGHAALGQKRIFVAGWNRGDYIAQRSSAQILVHPVYDMATSSSKHRYDLAFLVLDTPISADVITPIPLAEAKPTASSKKLLLGYHNTRPHVLSGSDKCRRDLSQFAELLFFDCEVVGGNSGGPVLHRTDDGWTLAGVIVARAEREGNALAVPVNDWMRDIWRDALRRAAAQP